MKSENSVKLLLSGGFGGKRNRLNTKTMKGEDFDLPKITTHQVLTCVLLHILFKLF